MTKSELIKMIDDGSDILFDVSGRHFAVFTWLDEGIGIGEQNTNNELEVFPTAEELVCAYRIGGKTLEELCSDVVITDYTGCGNQESLWEIGTE